MRANAPIQALLALAAPSLAVGLSLATAMFVLPAQVYAHPTHTIRRTTLQTPTPTPARPSAKKHAAARPQAKPQNKSNANAKAKAKSKAQPKNKHPRRRHQAADDSPPPTINRIHAPAPNTRATPNTQATPSDFLRAAATPQPVINVIRPTPRPPALPSIQQAAATPLLLPSLYNKRGRLIVPPALKGSHEILLHQNEIADSDGLDRIRDDNDILDLREQKLLVPIPTGSTLLVDDRLPTNRRYCRPWTAQFLATVATAYYERFHSPLQVNSAVRTIEFQQRLLRTNGNAAPAEGDTASPHLTGQAIDLAKHNLSMTQIAWLRGYLRTLVQQGKIDVEEEFKQACFHISVYKRYMPVIPRRTVASTNNATVQAAND